MALVIKSLIYPSAFLIGDERKGLITHRNNGNIIIMRLIHIKRGMHCDISYSPVTIIRSVIVKTHCTSKYSEFCRVDWCEDTVKYRYCIFCNIPYITRKQLRGSRMIALS